MTTMVLAGLVTAQFGVIAWLVTVVVRVGLEQRGGGDRGGRAGSGDGYGPPPLHDPSVGEMLMADAATQFPTTPADYINLSTLPPEVAEIIREFTNPAYIPADTYPLDDLDAYIAGDPDPNPAIAWDSRYDGYTDPMAVPVTPTARPKIGGLRPGQSPIPLSDPL